MWEPGTSGQREQRAWRRAGGLRETGRGALSERVPPPPPARPPSEIRRARRTTDFREPEEFLTWRCSLEGGADQERDHAPQLKTQNSKLRTQN